MRRLVAAVLLTATTLPGSAGFAADEKKRVRDDVENAGDPADKMICKRSPVIGSLVATQKECHTKREWDSIRTEIRRIQGSSSCSSPNGC